MTSPLKETVDVLHNVVYIGWFLLAAVVVVRVWKRLPRVFERAESFPTPWGPIPLKQIEEAADSALAKAGEAIIEAPTKVVAIGQAVEHDVALPMTPGGGKASTSQPSPPDPEAPPNLKTALFDENVIAKLRAAQREKTEELIRAAAIWGWTKNEQGYVEPPEPVIEWDGDRPRIVDERGGVQDTLEGVVREIRRQERAKPRRRPDSAIGSFIDRSTRLPGAERDKS